MNACKDRTSELSQIISLLKVNNQKSKINGYSSQKVEKYKSKRSKLINERSKFTNSAKIITNNISNTCLKLETLNNLIKSSTLFNDKSEEIQNYSNIIKSDILQLTNEIKYLSENSNQYSKGRQIRDHSASIIDTMQKKVKKMSNNFDELLHCQLETLKRNAEKRDNLAKPVSNGHVNKGFNTSDNINQIQPKLPEFLLMSEMQSNQDDNNQANNQLTNRVTNPLLSADQQPQKSQLMQQMHLIDRTDQYVESRSASIQQVERTIVDMGVIFKQLSQLIHEQGEQIESIDNAVEETVLNVEAGHSELLKFYQSVTNNRWLMIKVFGVLFVFVILFVVLLS